MKSAQVAGVKWQIRATSATGAYLSGAETTQKDQASAAIAAKAIYQAALQDSFTRDAYAKGLSASGKAGWLAGVRQKGANNYPTGVGAQKSLTKYVEDSGRFDSARGAAASLPRATRGNPGNLARVAAVANALHAVKIGK